jgi:metal-responsive CopG/Arc/MetJ family transcriptional regulator
MAHKIKIDKELYDRLEKCAKNEGYSNTEEFIIHTLEKKAVEIDSGDDEEKVKEKLRGLGYLS